METTRKFSFCPAYVGQGEEQSFDIPADVKRVTKKYLKETFGDIVSAQTVELKAWYEYSNETPSMRMRCNYVYTDILYKVDIEGDWSLSLIRKNCRHI